MRISAIIFFSNNLNVIYTRTSCLLRGPKLHIDCQSFTPRGEKNCESVKQCLLFGE